MRALPLLLLLACPVETDPSSPDSEGKETGVEDTDTGDTAVVTNTAPSAPTVAISPASPSESATLRALIEVDSVDLEGEPVAYRYEWSQNGVIQADLTSDYVDSELTLDADVWTLNVFASDGKLEGLPGTSTVTIGNVAPTAPVIHFDPAAPVGGDDLTLVFDTPADDANRDVLSQSIEWWVNGTRNTSWDGDTTIAGMYVDGGETYRVVVTVSDGNGDPVAVEASVTIINTAPVIASVTISPTDPSDDEDLTCVSRSSDADGSTPTTTYTWFRDGLESTEVGNNSIVDAALTTIGESWECMVEVSDGVEAITATSAAVEILAPTGYRITATMELTITEDTAGNATATGSTEWDIMSGGGSYSTNDCDMVWALTATENTTCRGCTYSFGAEYIYDASASSTVSGCAAMPFDSSGDIQFDDRSYKFVGTLDTPYYSLYTWYSGTELRLQEYGSGGYVSSYYGYTRGHYYSVVETADAYGNTVLSAYSTRYTYY